MLLRFPLDLKVASPVRRTETARLMRGASWNKKSFDIVRSGSGASKRYTVFAKGPRGRVKVGEYASNAGAHRAVRTKKAQNALKRVK